MVDLAAEGRNEVTPTLPTLPPRRKKNLTKKKIKVNLPKKRKKGEPVKEKNKKARKQEGEEKGDKGGEEEEQESWEGAEEAEEKEETEKEEDDRRVHFEPEEGNLQMLKQCQVSIQNVLKFHDL